MDYLWLLLTCIIAVKFLLCNISTATSIRFLYKTRLRPNEHTPTDLLFIVIPVLWEQAIIQDTFARFTEIVQKEDRLRLIFVTTAKEDQSAGAYPSASQTTRGILDTLLQEASLPAEKVVILHYPERNKVVAEQLNFALDYILQLDLADPFLAIYNADSVVTLNTITHFFSTVSPDVHVYQQSSLFVWNIPSLVAGGRYYAAACGLRQSCWTLQHELFRLLLRSGRVIPLPAHIRNSVLINCVSHGLFIRSKTLQDVGGFPVLTSGAEDLALGFVLSARGYDVQPLCVLENAETPRSMSGYLGQMAGWFLGPLGYLHYWRLLPYGTLQRYWMRVACLATQGVVSAIKWLLMGPLILTYLCVSWYLGVLYLGILVYLTYIYSTLFQLLFLWNRLPRDTFPRLEKSGCLSVFLCYPVVPIMHSLPAFRGLWWSLRIVLKLSFEKPKTER